MAYEVIFSKAAFKELSKLQKDLQERILSHAEKLREDPFTSRSGADIKKYRAAEPPLYRLRIGDYRVVYIVEGGKVDVTAVRHRSNLR